MRKVAAGESYHSVLSYFIYISLMMWLSYYCFNITHFPDEDILATEDSGVPKIICIYYISMFH
jgi:hypothetical protein